MNDVGVRGYRAGTIKIARKASAVLCALFTFGLAEAAFAAPVAGPEINAFACQGRAEVLQVDRSISQIQDELEKKLKPEFEESDPPTERAIKLCIIGELKKRVGHADAIDYYERAIEMNPDEPGFEMFAGKYYGGARGAGGAVVEMAEKHYYRALEKLENLRATGRYREHHVNVEDHVRKGLLTLYQKDGMPLLPWKAHPQRPSGYMAPGLSVATQFNISRDTRDGPGGFETGGFTAEAGLYVLRTGLQPLRVHQFEIVRQPLRWRSDTQLRVRHNYVGAVDLLYTKVKAEDAAITTFGDPFTRNDIDVEELGVGYERVIPLYPLFDFNLRGAVKHVERTGLVEWFGDCTQKFPVYEIKPSLSRFITSDKLTVNGTLVFMDIPDVECEGMPPLRPGQIDPGRKRGRAISAINFEYAFYSPLLLPSLHLASLRPYRTPTRGLYINGGYVNDNEIFGDRRVINETFYLGARLEGPGAFDIGVTESLYVSRGNLVDARTAIEEPTNQLAAKSLRSSITVARRLINPDETPGLPNSWGPFASHSLNWVFPASFDKVFDGRKDFENFRVGTQLWYQFFGLGFWGPAFLLTAGYDYQYFYNIDKHMHNVNLTLRMGWRDL